MIKLTNVNSKLGFPNRTSRSEIKAMPIDAQLLNASHKLVLGANPCFNGIHINIAAQVEVQTEGNSSVVALEDRFTWCFRRMADCYFVKTSLIFSLARMRNV